MDIGNPRKWALLTGAGFSASWGAPTVKAIWGDILRRSDVQSRKKLRDALLQAPEGFNFELVLARVQGQKDAFDDEDRNVLNGAVYRAYARIDEILVRAVETANVHSAPDNGVTASFLDLFWEVDPSCS